MGVEASVLLPWLLLTVGWFTGVLPDSSFRVAAGEGTLRGVVVCGVPMLWVAAFFEADEGCAGV